MSRLLTTSAAARLLGISSSTLKRWATVGLITSERTTGGHRRFRHSDIQEIVSPRDAVNDEPRRWASALLGDEETLTLQSRLFEMQVRVASWWDTAELLTAVVFEIYRRRDRGDVTALQVQYGLESLVHVLGWARSHIPVRSDAPVVLLTHVPGTPPDVMLAIVEPCLAAQGWKTRWAGAASPKDIRVELTRRRPDALIIAASLACKVDALEPLATEVASTTLEANVPLAFIGLGPWPENVEGASRLRGVAAARTWIDNVRPERTHATQGSGRTSPKRTA